MKLDTGRREPLMALAGFGLMIVVSLLCGYRMTIPHGYYQLLGTDHLADRLFESILYLHAQPPLLNLGLGIALKLSRVLGLSPETLLLAAHVALGAVGIWGFARLAGRLIASPWIRRVCIGFVVLHPALYLALFHYFYTFHELVLLSLIPLCVMTSIESQRVRPYALLCGLCVALVYTHSLFHWGGAALLLGAVAWLTQRASTVPAAAGGHLACLGVALVLLLAWPAKNWLLLGEFSYTTWGGYSLALELPIPREEVPTRNWQVPERFRHIPVLSEPNKVDGSRNWNHHSMIGHAHQLGALALHTLSEDPAALWRKATLNYWNYTRFSARHPYTGEFGNDVSGPAAGWVAGWMRAYEVVFFLDLRAKESLAHRAYRSPPRQSWAVSGFVFAFPLLLAAAGVALYRRWPETSAAERSAVALLLATLLWVLLATLLVDGSEANRIRFSSEPYLPLLFGWLLAPGRRPEA